MLEVWLIFHLNSIRDQNVLLEKLQNKYLTLTRYCMQFCNQMNFGFSSFPFLLTLKRNKLIAIILLGRSSLGQVTFIMFEVCFLENPRNFDLVSLYTVTW